MRVLNTRVNFQAFEHIPAQLILGQHSPDRQLDYLLRLLHCINYLNVTA